MSAQSKRAVAVGAAVVLAAIALLVWTTRRPRAATEVGVTPPRSAAVDETRGAAAPTALDSSALEARTVSPSTEAPAPEGALQVVVVERAGGARVGDAEVRFASDDELARVRDRSRSWIGTLEENLVAIGHAARTNARGEAWIAPSSRPATVGARKGELWNYRTIPMHGEGTLAIELVLDRELVLQVVDRAGRPVGGVPVALLSTSPQGFTFPLWQERTAGDDGRAVVRHVDVLLEAQSAGGKLAAGFDFLLHEPNDVVLDRHQLPREPVVLVLPPNGAADVTLGVDPDFAATASGPLAGEVWLEHADPKPPRGVFIQKAGAEDGRALFSHVGVGLSLVVKAKNVFGFKPATLRGSGPEKDGERVHFTLELDDPYPALTGRLVDARGEPLANRTLEGRTEVRREEDTVPAPTLSATSDAVGAFRVVLQVLPLPGLEGAAYLTVHGPEKSFEGQATIPLPSFLERGDNAVGDVIVEPVEHIVSGVVTGADGEPLSRVWVNVQRGETLEGTTERARWLIVPELQARTDRDGSFTVLGRAPNAPLRVLVSQEGYLRAEGRKFAVGARDVRIQLEKSALLVGSVLTPDYFPLDVLHARIKPRDATGASDGAPPARTVPVLMDRTFQVADLRAGGYTVDLMLQGDTRPLASFADIRLASGESVHDPRLVDIDLRAELRCVRLRVEDSAGDPVEDASVWVGFGTAHERTYKVDGKEARAVLRGDERDLDVGAPGYRPVTLRNVVDDQVVVLSRRIEIELVLAAGSRAPEPPYRLGVKFRPLAPDGAEVSSAGIHRTLAPHDPRDRLFDAQGDLAFDSTGRLSALLSAPGSYRLEWSVSFAADGVGAGSTFTSTDRDRIDVHESSDLQTFEVLPDAVQYARLLEALEKAWNAKR